jgi:hypothetical protein
VKLLKVSKLFRNETVNEKGCLSKIRRFFLNHPGADKLFSNVLFYFIFAHLSACIWYFVGNSTVGTGSWIWRNNIYDKPIMQKYMASLYWITQTIITVGYGDIGSETQAEKFLSIIAIFAGVIYFSLTVGSLTSLIQDAEQKSEQYERQVSLLKELKITYKLPSPLCHKAIRKIKQLVYSKEPNYSELLESLPISFRIELGYAMYSDTLKDINFFDNMPSKFIAFIGPLLTKVEVCQEEIIYSKDEIANEMFFIKSGTVSLN